MVRLGRPLAVLAFAALAVACGGDKGQTVASSVPGTTAVPVTTTTTTEAPKGTVLGTKGALLVAAPQPTVQSTAPPTAKCSDIGDTGWTVECGTADMAGGTRTWLVEKRAGSPTFEWRAKVVHWSQGKGAWLVDLTFGEAAGTSPQVGAGLTSVVVKTVDLTGDGKAELVFGYRSAGSGSILSYDIVGDDATTGPKVLGARQLSHGQATVAPGVITDYEAAYPNNEPNCCPAYFTKSEVRSSGGVLRVAAAGQVPPQPGPGRGDF